MAISRKILVVDDERNIRESITKILERNGFSVDTSEDADQAVAKIEQFPYVLVLLDIMMPKINGMELLKTMREKYRECNVVMITGYPSINTATEAVKVGALDYLPKPFTPDELLKIVNRVFDAEKREGFCDKGRMFCEKYKKTGECKKDCALKKVAERKAALGTAAKERKVLDVDLPYDYDEVARATSESYAKIMSDSDIPIIGWKRYYEENKKVLVIDDEMVVCNSVRKILENSGYEVDHANTTEEAVLRLEKKKYALALVDLRLPTTGGLQLLRQIKESWPELKTVVITGYASIDTAIETTRLGAMSYLAKPFTPEELNHVVEDAMAKAA